MYEKAKADPKTFEMIKARERAQYEYQARLAYAERQGKAEGRAEGMQQGRAEGALKKAIESAKNMLRDKMPIDLVSKYCGLPIDQAKSLHI